MNDLAGERRIAVLVEAYADRAPIDVDPAEMTRLAASGFGATGLRWRRSVPQGRRLALAIAVVATMTALVGAVVFSGGGPPPVVTATSSPETSPRSGPGYLGLPPVGASPSLPETGELVVSYSARSDVDGGCCPTRSVWLYADGRLLSDNELAGRTEQRLTPAGVELLRSAVLSTGLFESTRYLGHVDHFWWGEAQARNGDRLISIGWSAETALAPSSPKTASPADALALVELHRQLLETMTWLPAAAWDQPEVKPFVASRYAVCLADTSKSEQPAPPLEVLPFEARRLLLQRGMAFPGAAVQGECRTLTTTDARTFVALLATSGFKMPPDDARLTIHFPEGTDMRFVVLLDPLLPDGELG